MVCHQWGTENPRQGVQRRGDREMTAASTPTQHPRAQTPKEGEGGPASLPQVYRERDKSAEAICWPY